MSALLDSANLDLASTPGLPPVAPVAPASSLAPPPLAAIPTAQQARVLDGVHTEVFVQIYADRILVIVTQLGRIGCLIQVSPPPSSIPTPPPSAPAVSSGGATGATPSSATSILSSLPPPHPSTVLSPLFGVPPDAHLASLHDVYAAQIGAIVFRRFGGSGGDMLMSGGVGSSSRPVVVGLGLKPVLDSTAPDEASNFGLSERDKETFAAVMEMVIDCLA